MVQQSPARCRVCGWTIRGGTECAACGAPVYTGPSVGAPRMEPAALLATHDEPAEAARWQLGALDPGPGYAAALVVEGRAAVRCWQWPGVAAGAGGGEPGRAG